MRIDKIKLKNFRNHINKSLTFDVNLTKILGSNGSGKTNILESIYIMAAGKSQRAHYDKDLINYEHTFCSIEAEIANKQDEYKLELQIIKRDNQTNYTDKRVKINKVTKSVSALGGIFNAVMFVPEDISVITGAPSDRRRFLDLLLSQTHKEYRRKLNAYTKVVRQRNKLLELINQTGKGWDQMDFWNEQLIQLGSFLAQQRQQFFEYAQENISDLVEALDHKKASAQLTYTQSPLTLQRLDQYKDKEVYAKSTLIGPHREDFEITHNQHNVASFGSRGQQRTLLLTLKLLEIGFIEQMCHERPVLLLDDIFSELDDNHRKAVFEIISKQQTIITSAESEDILGNTAGETINL